MDIDIFKDIRINLLLPQINQVFGNKSGRHLPSLFLTDLNNGQSFREMTVQQSPPPSGGAPRPLRGDVLADRRAVCGPRRSVRCLPGRAVPILHRGTGRLAPAHGREPRSVDAVSGGGRYRDGHAPRIPRLRPPGRRADLPLQPGARRGRVAEQARAPLMAVRPRCPDRRRIGRRTLRSRRLRSPHSWSIRRAVRAYTFRPTTV